MLKKSLDFIQSRHPILILFLVFLLSLAIYLGIAWSTLAHMGPIGYYGPTEAPRFADPWLARTETILNGGQLYKDVFTATPPLTNYLLVPPSWVALRTGTINPWATSSFMVYFSLFNFFTAVLIYYMFDDRQWGYLSALFFLLNPLTFGNTILRRQDESIIVFFIAVSLYFILRQQHTRAAISIGVSLLVKLTGAIPLPIGFWYSKKWQYGIFPPFVFLLGMIPWFITVGRAAMFWDTGTRDNQHPFQFDGVSLGRLWNKGNLFDMQIGLTGPSIIFVGGVCLVLIYVMWQRFGILEDLTLVTAVVLMLTPKLHTGYFSILVLFMAPLVVKHRRISPFLLFGVFALAADLYKWPIENFYVAFSLMLLTFVVLIWLLTQIIQRNETTPYTTIREGLEDIKILQKP